MASSNRHWPSMFKSKPCNPNHQFQHDINSPLMSTGCHRSPYTSDVAAGCDEKSPEPKPRWNPKPEQIRILEAIFNSGMVNPPRDEIRKIRIQLQEYGEVGDANVFYWFQNRKSRSKHKLRHLHNTKNQNSSQAPQNPAANSLPQFTATSPPSSSSEKSPPEDRMMPPNKGFSIGFSNVSDVLPNSPTASVNQTYFQVHNETNLLIPPPPEAFFPVYHNGQEGAMGSANAITTQGFGFSDLSNVIHQAPHQPYPPAQQNVGPSTNLLLSEIMIHGASSKKYQDQDKAMKIMHQQHPQFISFNQSSTPTTTVVPSITNTTVTVPSPITQFQGVGDAAATPKSTVFINGVAFEVSVGPFNVREAFGDEAVLIQSSGYPVLTDEWGVTLHPLQHGESYYLI